MKKPLLRQAFLKARARLKREEVEFKSERIGERLGALEAYQKAKVVLFYYPKGNEVDTRPLIEEALREGKRVALPVSADDRHLEARQVRDLESDCEKGRFGILEPRPDRTQEVSADGIDCFVIPGIAFDLKGYRLGHGGGYFDRFLARVRPPQMKIGLAYEIQVCEALDVEAHDVKVDVLVTEKRVIKCLSA